MFIIRKIILLLIFNFLFPFSNFIYDEDDWFIIKNLGQIQSFTEDNYNKIIIGTINGIFIYDKLTDELIYDIYLTRGLPSINIKNIFYDKSTDHIWVYHDEGVSFKPLSSFSCYVLEQRLKGPWCVCPSLIFMCPSATLMRTDTLTLSILPV